MRYPTLTPDEVERLTHELLGEHGHEVDATRAVKWVGSGADVDLGPMLAMVQSLRSDLAEFQDSDHAGAKDRFEGRASTLIHAALIDVPIDVLDDPGFWRYVSMVHLWWFAHWREQKTFDGGDYRKIRVYVDGKRHAECIPLRMYLRGRIASDAGDPELASAAAEATDLWRSHIVRVRTSYSPELAAELVRRQADDERRMATDPLRAYAKRINRVASNVALSTYDRAQVEQLLDDLA